MIVDVVHANEFEQTTQSGVCIVDFWAPWCGPCRMLSSVLEELRDEDRFTIIKINVDEAAELASKFAIYSVPLLILFKNGTEVARKTGFVPKSTLLSWCEEHL